MDSRRCFSLFTALCFLPVALHAFQGISARMNKSSVPSLSCTGISDLSTLQSNVFQQSAVPPGLKTLSSVNNLSSYIGGSGIDSTLAGSSDGAGMLICGLSTSPNFPVSSGAQQGSLAGSQDAFICSVDASGQRLWARYFGGPGNDAALACCHANGKVYVVGRTTSTSGLATSGSFQNGFGGGSDDAFVACFDESTGNLQNCTYYGGSDADEARAVCVLPNGNVAVGGTTNSTDLTMNGQQPVSNGAGDAFVVVLSPDLHSKIWSSYYGGRAAEEGRGIGSLSDGSVVFCGNTGSPNSGAYIAANVGEGSAPPGGLQTSGFLVRFDANGQRTWGRYVGGDHLDTLTCLVVKNDNIFLGGFTNSAAGSSNNFISAGAAQTVFAGGNSDAFICRLSQDGVKVWGSYVGGSGDDQCLALSVNDGLDVVCCGTTRSNDFPCSAEEDTVLHGPSDAFCTFFVRDGASHPASFLIGGKADDYAAAISLQSDKSVLLAGGSSSSDFPVKNAFQSSFGGAVDAFVQSYAQLYVVSVPDQDCPSVQCLAFPNPCTETLAIIAPAVLASSITQVSVQDELGQLAVLPSRIDANVIVIDVHNLACGSYLVRIASQNQWLSCRFVKR